MKTEAYEKLLSELGIPSDWSLEDREALLETECNKALDRINAVQQSGDMDKIKQLQERADELGKAIDYTRELQKSLSSGIVLDTQSEKDRQKDTLKALKEAGKEKTQTLKELADVTQSASNSSAGQSASNSSTGQSATQSGNSSAGPSVTPPVSNTSATQQPVSTNNANPTLQSLMRRAEMEVDGANWEKAKELYDKILNADPKNVEANLGYFMANRQIREKKKIPEAARAAWKNNEDLFQDTYFLRARRYGDAALKKEMDDMEKGRDYLLAIEELQRAKTSEDYKKAAGLFAKLGDFADAKTKRKEAVYRQAEADLKKANDIAGFLAAKKLFEELGDYPDAKKKAEECELYRKRKVYRQAEEALEKKNYDTAKKLFKELEDYSDSKQRVKECEEKRKQEDYQKAEDLLKENDLTFLPLAKAMFEDLEDYADSKQKAKECEEKIKQLQEEAEQARKVEEAKKNYQREYEQFEAKVLAIIKSAELTEDKDIKKLLAEYKKYDEALDRYRDWYWDWCRNRWYHGWKRRIHYLKLFITKKLGDWIEDKLRDKNTNKWRKLKDEFQKRIAHLVDVDSGCNEIYDRYPDAGKERVSATYMWSRLIDISTKGETDFILEWSEEHKEYEKRLRELGIPSD